MKKIFKAYFTLDVLCMKKQFLFFTLDVLFMRKIFKLYFTLDILLTKLNLKIFYLNEKIFKVYFTFGVLSSWDPPSGGPSHIGMEMA